MKILTTCILFLGVLIYSASELPGLQSAATGILDNSDCDPDSVYFKQQILPILQSNCAKSGCHNEESRKHGVVLNSYQNLMSTVEIEREDDDDHDDDSRGRGRKGEAVRRTVTRTSWKK